MATSDHALDTQAHAHRGKTRETRDAGLHTQVPAIDMVGRLQYLQRTVGNQAVNALLRDYAGRQTSAPPSPPRLAETGDGISSMPRQIGATEAGWGSLITEMQQRDAPVARRPSSAPRNAIAQSVASLEDADANHDEDSLQAGTGFPVQRQLDDALSALSAKGGTPSTKAKAKGLLGKTSSYSKVLKLAQSYVEEDGKHASRKPSTWFRDQIATMSGLCRDWLKEHEKETTTGSEKSKAKAIERRGAINGFLGALVDEQVIVGKRIAEENARQQYEESVKGGQWEQAAKSLALLPGMEIGGKVSDLSVAQRKSLLVHALIATVVYGAITTANTDSYNKAVMAANWSTVVEVLDAFPDSDIAAKLTTLPMLQLKALLGVPGIPVRVATLVKEAKNQGVVKTGVGMVGKLKWLGGSGPDANDSFKINKVTPKGFANEFANWVDGPGPEPKDDSVMNCWEAVLFIAYKAGAIDKAWLKDVHTAAAQGGSTASTNEVDPLKKKQAGYDAYYQVLEQKLNYNSAQKFTIHVASGVGSPDIPAGNIIFIGGLDHVVLAQGTKDPNGKHMCISLWVHPALAGTAISPKDGSSVGYGAVQNTTVEEIAGSKEVKFAAPPW